jgi:tetratricopeptide (TPR) repeat protein
VARISFKEKIILIIFGIVLFLVLIEISLRLAGFIHLSIQGYRNRLALKEKDTYRILCLGESTTFGYEDSYPSQLEKILNQESPNIKFKVINKGIPGATSETIVLQLPDNLDKYKPHIVLVMMGINDREITIPYKGAYYLKLRIFIKNLRLYKLARFILLNLKAKLKEIDKFFHKGSYKRKFVIDEDHRYDWDYVKLGWYYQEQGDNKKAEEMFKKAIETDPLNDWPYVELWQYYKIKNKFDEAKKLFEKGLEINPSSYWIHIGLGWFYYEKNDYNLAEEMFKKAIEINSKRPEGYLWLGELYLKQKRFEEAEEPFKKVLAIDPSNIKAYLSLSTIYTFLKKDELIEKYRSTIEAKELEYYNPITQQNYHRLKEIVMSRKIKLICVQYPLRSVEALRKIFKDREGIIFVDNEKIFKEAVKRNGYHTYFTDSFAGDFGHCTPEGNYLLATNIAKVILKEIFNIEPKIDG